MSGRILQQTQRTINASLPKNGPSINPLDSSGIWDDLSNTFMDLANEKIAQDYTAKGIEAQETEGSADNYVDNPAFSFTTAGKAFKAGQQQAYSAQKTLQLNENFAKLASEHQYDPDGFTKASEEFYNKFVADTPIEMRPQLNSAYNERKVSNLAKIQTAAVKRQREEQKVQIDQYLQASIADYTNGILAGMDDKTRAAKQRDFGLQLANAKANGIINAEQMQAYVKDIRVGAAVANHKVNMQGLSVDQQAVYLQKYALAPVDTKPSDKLHARNLQEKEEVLAELKKVHNVYKDNESSQYSAASKNLANIQRQIEAGEPVDPNTETYIKTLERIKPVESKGIIDKFKLTLNNRSRIQNEVTTVNTLSEIVQREAQLIDRMEASTSSGRLFSDSDKLILELTRRKRYELEQAANGGYVPGASVMPTPMGTPTVTPVERQEQVVVASNNLGKPMNYLPQEDETRLLDTFRQPVGDETQLSGKSKAAQEFAFNVPAEHKQQQLNSIAAKDPEAALVFGLISHPSKYSDTVYNTLIKGYDLPDGTAASDTRSVINEAVKVMIPDADGKTIKGYTDAAYAYYKGQHGDGATVDTELALRSATAMFGMDGYENYTINGQTTVPFEFGMKPDEMKQVWDKMDWNKLAQREGGYPVISTPDGSSWMRVDSQNAKSKLVLDYQGPGKYGLFYDTGTEYLPVLNSSNKDMPFILQYKEEDKMFDINTNMLPTAPQAVPIPTQESVNSSNMVFEEFSRIKAERDARKEELKLKTEFAKKDMGNFYKEIEGIRETADAASGTAGVLNHITEMLINDGLDTGWIEAIQTPLQEMARDIPVLSDIVSATTYDTENEVDKKQAFASTTQGLAAAMAKAANGSQITDADVNFALSQAPSLDKSVDGNLRIVSRMMALNEKMVERAKILDRLEKEHDDPRTVKKLFDEEWGAIRNDFDYTVNRADKIYKKLKQQSSGYEVGTVVNNQVQVPSGLVPKAGMRATFDSFGRKHIVEYDGNNWVIKAVGAR